MTKLIHLSIIFRRRRKKKNVNHACIVDTLGLNYPIHVTGKTEHKFQYGVHAQKIFHNETGLLISATTTAKKY